MAIDSKKILGDTADEWHERTGTVPSDYIGEGVHYYGSVSDLLNNFAKLVPDNAEVVINYRVTAGDRYLRSYAWGTALIPKKSPEEVVKEKYSKSGTGTGTANTL
jgi:hypothetical protein